MGQRRVSTSDLSLIAVFAALIAVFAMLPAIPVGPLGVPITLQTLAISLCGMVLGPWRGAAAVLLYLVVGLIGIPVFANFSGGLGVLAGPTVGYLVSFPLSALLIGFLSRIVVRRFEGGARWAMLVVAGLVGSFVFVHPLGILGMSINAGLPLGTAFGLDVIYWPGDLIKTMLSALIAHTVHRAFPDLLVRGRSRSVAAPA